MPPALSDNDSSGDEAVPAQKKGRPTKKPTKEVEEVEEDNDDDEGREPDEYIVEKIISHKFIKNKLVFDVKWQGYDDEKDRTWEPEDNMESAADVLDEYFDAIGGRPEPTGGQKRKGRPSGVATSESGTPASAKRVKHEVWSPPPGSWEHDVSHIDTVEENQDPKTGKPEKFAYIVWNNDRKTQHPLKHVYQKCPQKMLQYYESHLVFTHTPQAGEINGDDDGNNIMMKEEEF